VTPILDKIIEKLDFDIEHFDNFIDALNFGIEQIDLGTENFVGGKAELLVQVSA